MSGLDRELADLAGLGGAAPRASDLPASAHDPRAAAQGRRFLLALMAVAIGIVVLVFTTAEGASYAMSVKQVQEQAPALGGRSVTLEGKLVLGTLERQDWPCEYRFRMQQDEHEIEVRYPRCTVPDTLANPAGSDVTATGTLGPNGRVLQATLVLAKCPSRYESATRGRPSQSTVAQPERR